MVNDEAVKPVEEHFTAVAKSQGLGCRQTVRVRRIAISASSSRRRDLQSASSARLVGKEDKIAETLEEAARVRADFGYPIMVTPLSQFVVSQAAINVIVGARYKEVTDQVIQYALGIWGKEATEIMDANVKDKILSRARAKDWQAWQPSDLSLHQVRQKFGATISDEELLLRVYAGPDAVDALTAAGAPKPQLERQTARCCS